MRIARSISAFLIAVAVALAPVASAAMVGAKPADMTAMAAMDDMADCCPGKADPCDAAMDCCQAMATCPLTCLGFSAAASSGVVFALPATGLRPALATHPFYSRTGSPPFRPPRV